jgi:hypothetical protein
VETSYTHKTFITTLLTPFQMRGSDLEIETYSTGLEKKRKEKKIFRGIFFHAGRLGVQ